MFTKLLAIIVVSVARFSLAAPTIEDIETPRPIPSAIVNGLPLSNDDIVGLAAHATEICGCPPGQVGFFIHGGCACSGDPIGPSADETGTLKVTGHNLNPHTGKDGAAAAAAAPKQARELSFRRKVERKRSGTERRAPVIVYPDVPDSLYYEQNDVQWQLECVAQKKCPKGLKGTVVRDGHCKCLPKKAWGEGPSMDTKLRRVDRGAAVPGLSGRTDSNKERDASAKLNERSDTGNTPSQDSTGKRHDASITNEPRTKPLQQRHDSSPCTQIQCPSGYAPTTDVNPKNFNLCHCKKDPGHSFPRLPGPIVDGAALGKPAPDGKERRSRIQIPIIDDAIIVPFPPQQMYAGPKAYHMCPDPQCPYAFIFHSHGKCECIDPLRGRQGFGGCGELSCPAGFSPKLNGEMCYCGIDGDSRPLPQGLADLGSHHGEMPEGDLLSASVDPDDEAAPPVQQQRSTTTTTKNPLNKRQDPDVCQNLGCPAGYVPAMKMGACDCVIDGYFPYPQAPASMGPQGIATSSHTADSGDDDPYSSLL
ncbi:MAG: hypothetical protein Q9216_001977 [Gyalolechia sp. 2 TL-2023]